MHPETILVVDDEKLIRWSIMMELSRSGYRIVEADSKASALRLASEHQPDLLILDQMLPDGTGIEILRGLPAIGVRGTVIMLTAVDSADAAVQAMKLGAADYITKPVNLDELKLVIEKALESSRMTRQIEYLRREQRRLYGANELIGTSPAMQKVWEVIQTLAESNSTSVLITGESGTGKELAARGIHYLSSRRNQPMLTVTCSTLADTLVESELFGHERGAFTDAREMKRGLFESAEGGSIFLDEIGDISLPVQVKLLRVLEQKLFRRVGGTAELSVNARVIAATNCSLEEMVAAGTFRTDLYYRLNVCQVALPPLRERGDDIVLLAEHFLRQFNVLFGKKFRALADETKSLFMKYPWPGNVRELRNTMERAVLLNDGELILPSHVNIGLSPAPGPAPGGGGKAILPLQEIEKETIRQALEAANNNQSEAARLLSVTRETLRYRMKKHHLL